MNFFTGQDDGPNIEEILAFRKKQYTNLWRTWIYLCFQDDASRWWTFLNHDKIMTLSDEDYEKFLLARWS
jgi:hypothetical protein